MSRPHPPTWAPHTWQGFSTGEWIGNALKVTTTHLKMAYLERNGVPRSDGATVVEYYARHGNVLTITTIVTDPVYLTEPFVRTRNFAAAPNQELNAYPCRPAVEIDREAHTVPHYLPGTNPSLDTATKRFGVPPRRAPRRRRDGLSGVRASAREAAMNLWMRLVVLAGACVLTSLPWPDLAAQSQDIADFNAFPVQGDVSVLIGPEGLGGATAEHYRPGQR